MPHTTEYDTRALVEPREGEVQDIATDIVEENVKIPDCLLKIVVEGRAFVVERLVDSEVLLEPLTLVIRSSDRNDLGPYLLPNLTYDRSCGTRCARDN